MNPHTPGQSEGARLSKDDRRQAREVFEAALDVPPAERAAFIEGRCTGAGTVLAEVRALLSALDAAGDGGEPRPSRVARTAALPSPPPNLLDTPRRIGPYRLLERIGEGGFGEVFLAEQERPVRRRVAIKIVKPGMDSRRVVARFEQERQALAMMDHPNIARVLDGGATEDGRPYFVMELVRGEPITAFCARHALPLRERIELLRTVCEAVQHAHQKGVIHRDLKPSNVLVALSDVGGGRPVAKVIDFGIAKATGEPLTDKTLFTEHRQLVGTPEYMSPEQAEMTAVDVDTRTDVYALGVLLYELITGSTPLDAGRLRTASLGEMLRLIREASPEKPSTRLLTRSVQRGGAGASGAGPGSAGGAPSGEPRALSRLVRGDLDWVVMKAIEKDRTRRYDSAGALSADLQRFLDGRAVEAGPPGVLYRVRTVVRRNKVMVLALGGIAAAIVVGLGLALVGLQEARRERDDAVAARAGERQAREAAQGDRAAAVEALAAARRAGEESDRRRAEAERALYRATLGTAAAAIQAVNGSAALTSLRSVPEGARGWEWRVLMALADRRTASLDLPAGERAIHLWPMRSPERALAHTEHADGTLATLIWDVRSGRVVSRFDGGHGAIGSDDALAVIPLDGGARLVALDARTGSVLWSTTAPAGGAWALRAACFALDGSLVVASDGIGGLAFIDARTGAIDQHVAPDPPARYPLGFVDLGSGPARHVVYLGRRPGGFRLNLLDRADPSLVQDLPEANDISSARSHLVRNSNFVPLRGERLRVVPATRLAGGILPPDVDPAQLTVAVADTFGGLALVPLASGRSGAGSTLAGGGLSPAARYHLPAAEELVRQVAFTSDGESLLLRGESGRAGVIPRDAYAAAFSVSFGPHAIGRFTPDGALVARLGWGTVSVVDTAVGIPVWSRPLSSLVFHAGAWSPDGRRLMLLTLPLARTPDSASEVYVVDGDTGRLRLALGLTAYEPDPRLGRAAHPWIGHAADAAFLADGRHAVIAGAGGSLRVLDTDTGAALDAPAVPPTAPDAEDPGVRLVPSPDRALLAHLVRRPGTPGQNRRDVIVRDAASLAPVAELAVPGVSATRAAFAPEGAGLLVGYTDGSVVRWRLGDATPVWRSAPLAPEVVALAVSPDGSRVAALCEATQAIILDAATGEVLAELPLSGANVSDAVFTPDATLQVTSSATIVASLSPRARLEPVPRASRHLWPEGLEPPGSLQRARARVMDAYVLATACSPFGRGLVPALADIESSGESPETRALAASLMRTIGLPLRDNNNEGLLVLLAPSTDTQAIRRAVDLLAELAQRYPADPPVWANLGHALARLERWGEAASALGASARTRRDRGLEPYPQALALLAVALAALDQPEPALQAAREALAGAAASGEPIAPFAPALQARWDAIRSGVREPAGPSAGPDGTRR